MVSKDKFLRGIISFIDNDLMPRAAGNYKVILRMAKAAIAIRPDSVFKLIKDNTLISMFGVIDEHGHIDIDSLAHLLKEGLDKDEFVIKFKILNTDYSLGFTASDIETVKNYIERT